MISPLSIYQHNLAANGFIQDDTQLAAIGELDALFKAIDSDDKALQQGKSIYLWGKVGRGKTYLMDCFYQACAAKAQRLHYYRFMQFLHQRLNAHQGNQDPLTLVADDLLSSHKVLCLDEFFVSDIGDAMLLGRLMTVLFERGMVLVTTSNVEPKELYKDGLQRDRFIPAIKMLEANLNIINMQGLEDHRLANANGFAHYLIEQQCFGSDDLTDSAVYQRFLAQAKLEYPAELVEYQLSLIIESRTVECLAKVNDVYLFGFEQLFIGPRSAADYIAVCGMASKIYLINVPQMGGQLNERKVARGTEDTHNINQRVANRPFVLAKGDDEARRFISFIDEVYDQKRPLVIGAQVALADLYLGGRVVFEFERAYSRIIEMQND